MRSPCPGTLPRSVLRRVARTIASLLLPAVVWTCSGDNVAGPPQATQLAFSVLPTLPTGGAVLAPAVKVEARDASGSVVPGYTGTVTIALGNNAGGAALGGTKMVAAVNGVATFADLTIDKMGAGYTLRATATSLTAATSTAFDVLAGPAARLAVTAQPTNATAGSTITPAVIVTAQDLGGNTASGYTGLVTLAITGGTGTAGAALSGPTTLAALSGVVAFSGLTVDKSGNGYTLSATASGVTTGVSAGFAVVAGAAAQLAFATQPSNTTAGVAIAPAVTVTAQDALGNAATAFGGMVTVAITSGTGSGGAMLSGTVSVTATTGVATFSTLRIDKTGTAKTGTGYTLSATAAGLTDATSDPFDILTGTATRLAFAVAPANATAGSVITPLVVVAAFDAAGNTVTSYTGDVTLSMGTNPSGTTLGGTTTVTAVGGEATFTTLHLDKVASGYTLVASAPGLTATTSPAFAVTAAPAAQLVFSVQPVTTTGSAPITPAVRVTALDAFGNFALGFAGNVSMAIGNNAGGGTLSGAATLAAVAGVATFSDLHIDNVGTGYTLTASAAGIPAVSSSAFDIIASAAAKLVFSVQPTATTAGASIAPAIQVGARDASNQPVASFTGAVTVAIASGAGAAGATLSGTTTVAAVNGVATFSDLSIDKSAPSYTFTATAGGLQTAVSATFPINAGMASQLLFAVEPSTATAASPITPQIEVIADDALGNVATGFTGDVTLAIDNNPAGGVLGGTVTVAAVAGVAAFDDLNIDKAGTGYTLTAAAVGPAAATSAPFDVTAAAASKLVFTTQPASTGAGATLAPAVQVTARDSVGNTVSGFAGTVSLTITSGTGTAGATLSGTASVVASGGVAVFSDLSIATAGTGYALSATAPGLSGATSAPFTIAPGAATHLAFTGQPTPVTAGVAIAPAVTVAALDALGNTAPGYVGTVVLTLGVNPVGATLSGTTSVAASNGIASFGTLSLDKSGAGYTLSASSGALTGVTSAPFDVTAGPAVALTFTVQPSQATAGAAIAPAVQVTAVDGLGNRAAGFASDITVVIASNPAAGTLSGSKTQGATAGVASFSTLSVDRSGSGYTLAATAGGLANATSAPFSIVPGAATTLVFSVQPTTATANANLSPPVQATARDALGNTATAYNGNVTVAIGTNPGGGTLSGTRTFAAVNGVVTYGALSINNTGSGYTLTVSAGGLSGATSAPFNIITSTATALFFSGQPQNGTAGTALAPAVVVQARDASGQVATSYAANVTLAITSATGAAGAVLTGIKTVTAVAGVATFNGLSLDKSAVGYKLTATAGGLPSTTSAFFTISAGAPTQLAFTLPPSTATIGTVITPKVEVTARDAQGNTATGFAGTVTVAIGTNPSGGLLSGTTTVTASGGIASFSTLSIDKAGTGYTVTAAATGLTGTTSGPFDVTATRATQLAFTVQPTAATAGTTIAPAVKVAARDASGNIVTGFTGSITLVISAGTGTAGATLAGTATVAAVNGVATFSTLGIDRSGTGYRLAATAAGVSGATSSAFTINAGTATRVSFTVQPASSPVATIIPGAGGATIQVTARDALGNPDKTFSGSVTVSLVTNPSGGTLTGTQTVTAAGGVAEFNDLMIDRSGAGYRLDATAADLSPDTSDAISLSAGPAVRLIFTVQPSNAAANAAITPAMRVTALDAQGNVATGFSGNVTMTLGTNPSGGVLGGTTTVAAVNGVAVFTGLSISQSGAGYTLVSSAPGVTSATSVAFTIN